MTRRRKENGRRTALGCAALVCAMLCWICAGALGEIQVEIIPDEWAWEAGSVATFHGTVTSGENLAGADLSLTVETRLEDSGEALFTAVNGKKLKIRKRASRVTEDLTAGVPLEFEAEWMIPEDTDSGLARAVVTLKVLDSEGKEKGAGTLEQGSRSEDAAREAASPVRKAEKALRILLIAAGVVWAVAILRYLWIKKGLGGKVRKA